jgi:PTS system nitrogen regulatory IIA component
MYSGGVAGFDDLVAEGGITLGLDVADKPALLDALAAAAAAATGIDAAVILERVRLRESLGSTGFGSGAAIPHARFADLSGVLVQVVRLAAPVDYGALDEVPVDIAVLLLSPEAAGADHLKALARISRTLRDPVRLAAPVDYGALDEVPVDIAVLLLSPEAAGADHLKALARISRTLRDPVRLAAMRAAGDAAALRAAIAVTVSPSEAPRRAA